MSEELARSGDGLTALTEYAQRMHNQQWRDYINALSAGLPPAPPPSIWRRLRFRIENWRERFADSVRRVADWIDPYA